MRTLAVHVVLSHVGCPVPAAECHMKTFTRMHTRLGTSDSLCDDESTFSLECKQVAQILKHAGSSTFVLIDEFGRGTSHTEGVALCWAVCEKIAGLGCVTVLSTHYREVAELASRLLPCVRCFHVTNAGDSAVHTLRTHSVVPGPAPLVEGYGIRQARQAQWPEEALEEATALLRQCAAVQTVKLRSEENEARACGLPGASVVAAGRQLTGLLTRSTLGPAALTDYLKNLQSRLSSSGRGSVNAS
eukprot:GHVU01068999.1.p1 GENE.GHVU01068999.1~~GHVU01068999.1.p1  ORF type:complete len:245 (-),score=30.89 GHVU01068999.1:103-837(-)